MISKIFQTLLIFPIRAYQLCISPFFAPKCRHTPSCSNYAIEAIRKHGALKGFWFASRRVLSCHPWGAHGYDPVPKKVSGEEVAAQNS